jgi:hypothetical protein
MAVSEVSICSNALRRLGQSPISSLTETTVNASRCNDMWPTVRDMILRAKLWNCCKARVLLPPLAEADPLGEWQNQFQKPGDWLRTVRVGKEGYETLFKDEGGKFLADESALPVLYIFRNTNAATYDSGLVLTLELAMKAAMAYAVTKSAQVEATALAELKASLVQAGAISSQDDGPEDIGAFDLMGARFRTLSLS